MFRTVCPLTRLELGPFHNLRFKQRSEKHNFNAQFHLAWALYQMLALQCCQPAKGDRRSATALPNPIMLTLLTLRDLPLLIYLPYPAQKIGERRAAVGSRR